VASGSALGREAARIADARPDSAFAGARAAGRELTGQLVTELAHDGDADALEALELIGRRLGVGIANLVNVFNPEVVVIGGGVIAAGERLLEPAREEMAARALPPLRDVVKIVPARFAHEAGMVGAAALAFDGLDAVAS
jgi:glucokinase